MTRVLFWARRSSVTTLGITGLMPRGSTLRGMTEQTPESRPLHLELGCGSGKRNPMAVGVDVLGLPGVDVVGDALSVLSGLTDGPWPASIGSTSWSTLRIRVRCSRRRRVCSSQGWSSVLWWHRSPTGVLRRPHAQGDLWALHVLILGARDAVSWQDRSVRSRTAVRPDERPAPLHVVQAVLHPPRVEEDCWIVGRAGPVDQGVLRGAPALADTLL